jgi:type I restriction enzyme S subunit
MNNLLLEHFDELISTPEDVEKLNRTILQLAMQGKLVEQNPNDEPAIELLKQIREEKAKEKKGKKSAALPLIESDETPFDLPKGWEWVRLGELVNKWVLVVHQKAARKFTQTMDQVYSISKCLQRWVAS